MKKSKHGRQILAVVGILAVVAAVAAALGSPLWIVPALAAFLGLLPLFG